MDTTYVIEAMRARRTSRRRGPAGKSITVPVSARGSGAGLRFAERGAAFSADWTLEVRNGVRAPRTEAP